MNVSGPASRIASAYNIPQARPVQRPAQPAPVEVGTLPAAAASAGPVPAGRDPALWSILTTEERRFFERQAALGALSYGPGARAAAVADAPLGQRIDVRA